MGKGLPLKYHHDTERPAGSLDRGHNFQLSWNRAEPPVISITSFLVWISFQPDSRFSQLFQRDWPRPSSDFSSTQQPLVSSSLGLPFPPRIYMANVTRGKHACSRRTKTSFIHITRRGLRNYAEEEKFLTCHATNYSFYDWLCHW